MRAATCLKFLQDMRGKLLWQQGSVYVSQRPMLSREVERIVTNLVKNNDWLNICMRDCKQANIGREHDLNHVFDKTISVIKINVNKSSKNKKGANS